MKALDDSLKPSPNKDVDFSSLKTNPSPEDFFLLSRVDGFLTVGQLCTVSGLGKEKTREVLQRLLEFGLISIPGMTPPASAAPAPEATPGSKRKKKASAPDYSKLPIAIDDFACDPDLMAQMVEIDDERKREILCVHAQLEQMSYYELFGVEPDASRKEIRSAYFLMSKRFHPDLFYGKVLGDFQSRVERIFQHVTKGYQILSNRSKREEYDRALASQGQMDDSAPKIATPASQRSDPIEEIGSERKREMAFSLLVRRGDLRAENGDVVGAAAEFRKALRLRRDVELALRGARMLLDAGIRLDEAALFARAALKIDRENIDAMLILGDIYQVKNASEDALYHYERALELDPDNRSARERVEQLRS